MSLRTAQLARLREDAFDVLIIGGGINGAVSAAALAGQGVRVALLERGDFAGGTSSQSSNLVWGGIKYLESRDFGLVRRLCRSRNRLLDAYPTRIEEIRFLATLRRGFRYPRGFMWAGTWLYWLFGNAYTRPPRLLSRADIAAAEPCVALDDSGGGFEYSDAFLPGSDARFVFDFVRAALDAGAAAANYVEALHAEHGADGWVCRARDVDGDGAPFDIRARVLINAAGPYADAFNTQTSTRTTHRHVFSKGVHLIVDRITAQRRVLAFFASDGRLFFAIPMGSRTCIGTTDTRVERPEVTVTDADRDFILDNINRQLRLERPLTRADIVAERCGVRPLVVDGQGGDERDWLALSREHAVEVDPRAAHLTIFGGKLTDCLNIGEEVTARIAALGVAVPQRGARWYGEADTPQREAFMHQAQAIKLEASAAPGATEPAGARLWRRYGARAFSLLDAIRDDPAQAEELIPGAQYLRCELALAARDDMVVRLDDWLRRRTLIALTTHADELRAAPGVQEACRVLFGDEAERRFAEFVQEKFPSGH
ncbi:glycerol-3-phosphate dehydrogenase/oxidase [Acidihalobacter ferrooxydans]|uniref:FAD-dependent oxidoreductase n=1 Tax=Acidihalobacter ferrooxydans TaxID=1765967 RepID=A0A1P8UJK6_9GAMM|nr:FAD-dependent oxidoreductase [Acidihalobacter ferrooxydans]APZ44010.1 FAD-dependent oxidoreductase [Acidihalobacter ferrooxydans]